MGNLMTTHNQIENIGAIHYVVAKKNKNKHSFQGTLKTHLKGVRISEKDTILV
jgi:hypothetical protein